MLMSTENYWDLCVLLAAVAALLPETAGPLVWRSCPSARALLHALITRSHEYPPPSWPDASPAETLERERQVGSVNERVHCVHVACSWSWWTARRNCN